MLVQVAAVALVAVGFGGCGFACGRVSGADAAGFACAKERIDADLRYSRLLVACRDVVSRPPPASSSRLQPRQEGQNSRPDPVGGYGGDDADLGFGDGAGGVRMR